MLNEKENLKLLDERISELNLKGKVVIVFDFDELVVPTHLTRVITRKISRQVDEELLKKLNPCSFEGIKYLKSLAVGYDFGRYKELRDNIAEETEWEEGFKELLKELMSKYSVIFISSGMKDISESKLKEIDFDPRNIIGCEYLVDDNKIAGPRLIVSDELKGYIIDKLKKHYKVISVGHGLGDKTMLQHSNISISFNSKIPDLAQFNAKSPKQVLKIIEEELGA